MDRQASTTESDLEGMLSDKSMEAKALPFSLLDRITNGFTDDQQIGCGGFAVVYKVQTQFPQCLGHSCSEKSS